MLLLLPACLALAPQLAFTSHRAHARPTFSPTPAPLFSEAAAPPLPFAPALFGRGVTTLDVDRDGRQDFVIATASGAVLYRNAGLQGFLDETWLRLPFPLDGANMPIAGDVNGDGWVDLVLLADASGNADVLLLGHSSGVFRAPLPLAMLSSLTSDAELVDVDGDHDLDLVRAVGASGHTSDAGRDGLALNDGAGHFTLSQAFLQAPWNSEVIPTTGVCSLDANGDGRIDLYLTRADSGAATGSPGAKNQLLLGIGGGAFIDGSSWLPDLQDNSFGAIPLDIDLDGDLDLVVANTLLGVSGASSGDVLINQGGVQGGARGTFLDRFDAIDEVPIPSEAIRLGLLSADVDLDGRRDVLFRVHDLPPGGGGQPLFLGTDTGFARATHFDSGSFIAAGGAFADIDGDGDPDLLLTAAGSAGGGSSLGNARLFMNRTR